MVSNTTFWFINGLWSAGIDLPEPRSKHATVWVSSTEILICGGVDAADVKSNRCWMYNNGDDFASPSFNEVAAMAQPKASVAMGLAIKDNGER